MPKHPPRNPIASIQPAPTLPLTQTTKRARDDNDDIRLSDKSLIKTSKRRRLRPEVQENLDLVHGVNVAIGRMDTQLLADYVVQSTKRFQTELSMVELEDFHISGTLAY